MLKRWVLRLRLKPLKVGICWSSSDIELDAAGPAWEKARSPKLLQRILHSFHYLCSSNAIVSPYLLTEIEWFTLAVFFLRLRILTVECKHLMFSRYTRIVHVIMLSECFEFCNVLVKVLVMQMEMQLNTDATGAGENCTPWHVSPCLLFVGHFPLLHFICFSSQELFLQFSSHIVYPFISLNCGWEAGLRQLVSAVNIHCVSKNYTLLFLQ